MFDCKCFVFPFGNISIKPQINWLLYKHAPEVIVKNVQIRAERGKMRQILAKRGKRGNRSLKERMLSGYHQEPR